MKRTAWIVLLVAVCLTALLFRAQRPVLPAPEAEVVEAVPVAVVAPSGSVARPEAPQIPPPQPQEPRPGRAEGHRSAPAEGTDGIDLMLEHATVIEERRVERGDGTWRIDRLHRQHDSGTPLLRVEETWGHAPEGGSELRLHRVAMAGDYLVIKLAAGSDPDLAAALASQQGARLVGHPHFEAAYLWELAEPSLDAFDHALAVVAQADPRFEIAEPNYLVLLHSAPDDPGFPLQWALRNLGQTGGTPDADIDAPEAWEVTRGSRDVIVAIIDTGIDLAHPDLAPNLWHNPGEIAGNRFDDDLNGYVDDIHGWNFRPDSNRVQDNLGHGTWVAGVIGAAGYNSVGIIGVSPQVSLMALAIFDHYGTAFTLDAAEALKYARRNGARVINLSWGDPWISGWVYSEAKRAADDGVLVVASAGPTGNRDAYYRSLSAYALPNVITVTASDHDDRHWSGAAYGPRTIDLAAPGKSILTTDRNGGYRVVSGASFATAHVSGAAALLFALRPDWTWVEVHHALTTGADDLPSLRNACAYGRLNAAHALLGHYPQFVSLAAAALDDDPASGAIGNGDGIPSPGEQLRLVTRAINRGIEVARGVWTEVEVVQGGPHVQLSASRIDFGDLPSRQERAPQSAPLSVSISADAPTPLPFRLRFTHRDLDGGSWSTEVHWIAYRIHTISGRVTQRTTDLPLEGAHLALTGETLGGAVAAEQETPAVGTYSFNVVEGRYHLQATAAEHNPSEVVLLEVPPSQIGIDFDLGRAQIQVQPDALVSTQPEGLLVQQVLTISNPGDHPLTGNLRTVSIGLMTSDIASSGGEAATGENPESSTPPPATLPLFDNFEDPDLPGWKREPGLGVATSTSEQAAEGLRSLYLHNAGGNQHRNGISRTFGPGTRPRHVSFWLRPGAIDANTGFVALRGYNQDVILFNAGANGRFAVNPSSGGDNSVPFVPGIWHFIEFRSMDWEAATFDYHVDGALVRSAVPFIPQVNQFTRNHSVFSIHLYNLSTDSEAWWDSLSLLDHNSRWLSYTPETITIGPGESLEVTVTLDSNDLAIGLHHARIEIASNAPAHPLVSVPVTLQVEPRPNATPIAVPLTFETDEDTPVTLTLEGSDPDGDPISAVLLSLPAGGTLFQTSDGESPAGAILTVPMAINHPAMRLIFVPDPNAHGEPLGSFDYVVADRRSQSTPARVDLWVHAVNDLPVALDDRARSLPGQVIASIDVLANDSDVDGDPLHVASFTQGARGTVSLNADGTLRYAPLATFQSGVDDFHYTVADPHGGTATARVRVVMELFAGGDWPMMGRDPGHTGAYPARLGAATLREVWSRSQNGNRQPVIAAGRVFISSGRDLIAFDLVTGVELWRQSPATESSLVSVSGPAVEGHRVLVQCRASEPWQGVYAYHIDTGEPLWMAPFQAQAIDLYTPTVTRDAVYVHGGRFGGMYGYDLASGSQRFFRALQQDDDFTPTVTETSAFAFVRGLLTALDPQSGEVQWSLKLDPDSTGGGTATVSTVDGFLYAIDKTNQATELVCVDLSTRSVRWKVAAPVMSGTPALSGGRVYVHQQGRVNVYSQATGALLGTYQNGYNSGLLEQPIITEDSVISSTEHELFVWNRDTYQPRQTLPTGGKLALADGYVVQAGSYLLTVYAIETEGRHVPSADDLAISGLEDHDCVITLTGSDPDGAPLRAVVSELPDVGWLYQTDDGVRATSPILQAPAPVSHPQRKVIYRPLPDDFGPNRAQFGFRVENGSLISATAQVTISLEGMPDPPVARDATVHLLPRQVLVGFNPAANDTDPDDDPLTVVAVSTPQRGSLELHADGTVTYRPDPDFTEGSDGFDYTVADTGGATATARVTLLMDTVVRSQWSSFAANAARTSHYPHSLGTTPFTLRWSQPLGKLSHPPVVADGVVFTAPMGLDSANGHLRALNLDSGAERWRLPLPGYGYVRQPSWHRGRLSVYLQATSAARLLSLEADTGVEYWSKAIDAGWSTEPGPAVDDIGIVVTSGYFGAIRSFDPETGTEHFNVPMSQNGRWTPALLQGQLYTLNEGKLTQHDRSTGAALRTRTWDMDWWSSQIPRSVALDGDLAFFIVRPRSASIPRLHAVSLTDLSVRWTVDGAYAGGLPAVAHGVAYAALGDRVEGRVAGTGRLLRTYQASTPGAQLGPPVVADDRVIAASATRTFIWSQATGEIVQELPHGGTPVIAGDSILVLGGDHTLRRYGRSPAENRVPTLENLRVPLLEEMGITLLLEGADADGDTLSYVIRSLPQHGTLYQTVDGEHPGQPITQVPALVSHPSGAVHYQAPLDLFGIGADTFTVTAHDYASESSLATVFLDITGINDPPTAYPDLFLIGPDRVGTGLRPEANDIDPDGDRLEVIAFTQPARGSVTRLHDGSLAYWPEPGFSTGSDLFSYTVADPDGETSSAQVEIILTGEPTLTWPMAGGGASHAGYQPVHLGNGPFAARWSHDFGESARPLAVAAGSIFLCSVEHQAAPRLLALNAATGTPIWEVSYSGSHTAATTGPAWHQGRVYLAVYRSSGNFLEARDSATGSLVWSKSYPGQPIDHLGPVVDAGGVFIQAGVFGGLAGFDLADGSMLHLQALEQRLQWVPLRHAERTYSFVRGRFHHHDSVTGAVLGMLDLGGNWNHQRQTSAAAEDGMAFVVVTHAFSVPGDSELVAIDLSSLRVRWSVRTNGFHGIPAVARGVVYVNATEGVRAYRAQDGALVRTYPFPGAVDLGIQPVLTADALLAASSSATRVFDLPSATLRQQLPFGGSLALAGHQLVITTPQGVIHLFEAPHATNSRPLAQPLEVRTNEDVAVEILLTGSDPDGDPLTGTLLTLPATGTLHLVLQGPWPELRLSEVPANLGPLPARVRYRPPPDAHGDHLGDFWFDASDSYLRSAAAAVTVHVTAVNDPPVAVPDVRWIRPGQILSPVWELANDRDVEGDPILRVGHTQPVHGRVEVNADGTLRYHPPLHATQLTDTFTYTIHDTSGLQSSSTVTIHVGAGVHGHWPTQGGGPTRSGQLPATLGPGPYTVDWSLNPVASVSPAAVADGQVLITAQTEQGPTLLALAEHSGAIQWSAAFAPGSLLSPATQAQYGTYVQQSGMSGISKVWSFNAATGGIHWERTLTAGPAPYLAPLIHAAMVYVPGGTSGGLHALQQPDGTPQFFRALASMDRWAASAASNGEVFSYVRGIFTQHHQHDGSIGWSTDLGWNGVGASMNRMVAVAGRRAFLVHDGLEPASGLRELVALDLNERRVLWRRSGHYSGTPAVTGDRVHALARSLVIAHDLATGQPRESFAAWEGDSLMGQPVVSEDMVIAASAQWTYLFRRRDQNLLQVLPGGGHLSVGHDRILLADAARGTLTSFTNRPPVTFSHPSGIHPLPFALQLGNSGGSARVHYTVDGSPPQLEGLSLPAGSWLLLDQPVSLRAILVDGSRISPIADANFAFSDEDGDGLPDWWELQTFGNLTHAGTFTDSDGDGISDHDELIAGTDPFDAGDWFRILHAGFALPTPGAGESIAQEFLLQWPSKADRQYIVESSANLQDWIAETSVPGSGGLMQYRHPVDGLIRCHLRLRVLPHPQPTAP